MYIFICTKVHIINISFPIFLDIPLMVIKITLSFTMNAQGTMEKKNEDFHH